MMREQKCNIKDFIEFVPGDRTKKDVFKGEHFNTVVMCLESGYEIPPHEEPYDVLFFSERRQAPPFLRSVQSIFSSSRNGHTVAI